MAAITPDSAPTGLTRAKPLQGDRMEIHRFTNINNADVWTVPGGTGRIRAFYWRTGVANTVRWAKTANDTMTFTCSASPTTTDLMLLLKGGSSPSA